MPGRRLPPRPNLDQYRKQAKELLAAVRASDAGARRLFRVHHPRRSGEIDASRFRLVDAQLVIAREHGFTSWTTLAAAVEALASDAADTRASTVQLDITTDEINICALTPDGRRAITAAQGNPVTVWDARTGRRELTLDPASTGAWVASWTPDPRLVFVGSRSPIVGLWDLDRQVCVRELPGHGGVARAVATNAAFTRALTACSHRDTSVRLWDLGTGACLRTLDGHADGVYSLAWLGEDLAASGSRDTTIRIWDLSSGHVRRVLTGHTYHVHGLAWSRDGRRLLSSSMELRLWDAETGRCLRAFEGHTKVIRSVAWSTDERYALTASHDGTARLWRVDTGRCERVLEGHETGLVAASFSRDGRRVFTCDWLGGIRTWPFG